jgi:hypothetical protein
MVNVIKGGGRTPPPSPAQPNFTLMTECTPESWRCYSVISSKNLTSAACCTGREVFSAGGREYRGGDGRGRQDWNYETMLLSLQGDRWKEVCKINVVDPKGFFPEHDPAFQVVPDPDPYIFIFIFSIFWPLRI